MKNTLLMILMCCGWIAARAQEPLKGKVVSNVGAKPLAGVNVSIKATNKRTQTNGDGFFEFKGISGEVRLSFSLVGYGTKEITIYVPLKNELVVVMEENSLQLAEVSVSTGYQDVPKERATGAFSRIDRNLFNQQQSTDIISRLEAVGNSISVDRRTSGTTGGISIRGISTIQGVGGPLIVLDNFPYEGDLSNLNPNEVESISFLKDAAASSIWGAKAGNGVIVITTRKSKLNQQLKANFNAAITAGEKPDLFYGSQMSTSEYIELEQSLFNRGYYDPQIASITRPALSPVVELLLKQRSGALTAAATEAQLASWKGIDVRDEVEDKVYETLLNQQYALDLQAGGNNYAWLFSGGYDRNKDNLSAGFERYNLRYQQQWEVLKGLQLNADVWYTYSRNKSGKTAYNAYSVLGGVGLYPYAQLADGDGNALPVAKDYGLGYLETAGGGRLLDWKYYPLRDYLEDRNESTSQDLVANFGLRYTLAKGLTAELKYRFERQQVMGLGIQSENSYAARSMVNRFTQLPAGSDPVYKVPKGGIRTENNSQLNSQDLRGQLNYNRNWKDHGVAVIAGAERRNAISSGQVYRKYGYQEDTWRTGIVDYTTTYPTIVYGAMQFIPDVDGLTGLTKRFVSFYGNGAYTYKERYLVSVSGRRDASNLYGVNTNEKWNPLWSVGVGWVASAEPFLASEVLPYLKLRSSYGVSGNTDQGKSAVTIMSYSGTNAYTNSPAARIEKFANPELKWEKVRMFNVGMDFRLKGERLSGSMDYFEKRGLDLFGTDLLDYTGGAGNSMVKNVAKMKGKGIDVELNSINLKGKLGWNTQLNMSFYKDEVTAYYINSYEGSRFIGTGSFTGVSGLVGKPVYGIFSYRWAGLDPQTGDPRGYLNGAVSKDYTLLTGSGTGIEDLVYHGSALPTVYGSLGNTISYGNWQLTVRLLYKFGYYFRNNALSDLSLYSGSIASGQYSRRWQQPGDEVHTNVPSVAYPYNSRRDSFYGGSEVNVEKGDHIRLQYITLGYDLDKRKLRGLPVDAIHFFLNVNNIGLLWKATKERVDPDYPLNAILPGKTVSIGLRSTF